MEWKNCPHCGARMPEEMSFCPHCAKSVNNRKEIHPPRRLSRRAVCVLLIFLAVLVLALAVWRCTRPSIYDGGSAATVIYTDPAPAGLGKRSVHPRLEGLSDGGAGRGVPLSHVPVRPPHRQRRQRGQRLYE